MDRIACKMPGCANTILPVTAKYTDGLCMPCAQAKAGAEQAEYIRLNRRDVNNYEGVTDPVEILKLYHRPRNHDPLVNLIPYPHPIQDVYAAMTAADHQRWTAYLLEMMTRDDDESLEEAANLLIWLAAFSDANMDDCLRELASRMSEDVPVYSALPFRKAPPDVRDVLLLALESPETRPYQILEALAWIGDAVVVEHFNRWAKSPPAWTSKLFMPVQDYTREAAWELTPEGGRRDLFFPTCTRLVPGKSLCPDRLLVVSERTDTCPWCGDRLVNMLTIAPGAWGILTDASGPERLQVVTCTSCAPFDDRPFGEKLFGEYAADGEGRLSEVNQRPASPPTSRGDMCREPEDCMTPAGSSTPYYAAWNDLPVIGSQIGGYPQWLTGPCWPKCPRCQETMMFLAQIFSDDVDKSSEGHFYVHICFGCRTTATSYQQT